MTLENALNHHFFFAEGIGHLPNPFQLAWTPCSLVPYFTCCLQLTFWSILSELCPENFRHSLTRRILHSLEALSLFKYYLSDVVLDSVIDSSSSRGSGPSMCTDTLPTPSVPGSLGLEHSHQRPQKRVGAARPGMECAGILMQPRGGEAVTQYL